MSESEQAVSTASSQPKWDGFRPIGGLIYGCIAFIAAFVLTAVYFVSRAFASLDSIGVPHAIGWAMYKAHGINPAFVVEGETVEYFELIEYSPQILSAIPAVLLVAAGYVIARRVESSVSTKGSAIAGASVVVGYLPLFVILAPLFHVEWEGSAYGPELGLVGILSAAVFAGGFGAVGGYLYGR